MISKNSTALAAAMLFLAVCGARARAEDSKAPDKPPVASLTGKQKTSFITAVQGADKKRESACAEVAEWGPLSKKAAEELRKLAAGGLNIPPPQSGWKGKAAMSGGMREIDVPGTGKREYYLAIPPGYTPARNWPLIISFHGAGGEGKREYEWMWSKWAKQWPGFIACPSGVPSNAQWFPEQTPFVLAMLADLRKNFALDDDRLAVHGFSNGGHGAWYYGYSCPSHWCAMVSRSGVPFLEDYLENLLNVPCLITHGDQDQVIKIDQDRAAANKLKDLGYDVTYKEIAGGNHEPFLEKLNPEIMAWLVKQKRKTYPPKVVFGLGPPNGKAYAACDSRAYWAEISERDEQQVSKVKAEAKGDQIEINAANVKAITLWLSDSLVDLDKPVTVVWNGKTVHAGVVPRTGAALVDWLAATNDRAAAPVARLTVRP